MDENACVSATRRNRSSNPIINRQNSVAFTNAKSSPEWDSLAVCDGSVRTPYSVYGAVAEFIVNPYRIVTVAENARIGWRLVGTSNDRIVEHASDRIGSSNDRIGWPKTPLAADLGQ